MAALAGFFTSADDARRAAGDLLDHGLPAASVTLITEGDDLAAAEGAQAAVIADCEAAQGESIANAMRRNGAFDIQERESRVAGAAPPTLET